jgi:hypothetical protein
LEVPEFFAGAGLAEVGLKPARLSKHQHSNIPRIFYMRRLAHASAQLALA